MGQSIDMITGKERGAGTDNPLHDSYDLEVRPR